MLAAATVAAFASCAKELDNPEETSGRMKTITVKTDITTKTTLDANHANLVWSTGDKISIFNDTDNTNSDIVYEAGGDIEVAVPAATTEIFAHYPYFSGNNSGPASVSVYISNNQTQKNPGELNGYYFPMVAKGTVSADNKALVKFYPVASALALNIFHTGLSGEEMVTSVKVTPASSNTGFIGRQITDLTGDNITYANAESSDPITVTLTNPLNLGSTKPSDSQKFAGQIYVCLAKQSYANVKFEIETNKGTYTITSNNTPFNCVANDFVPINIDLAKATFEGYEAAVDPTAFSWTLVKDALAVGDKVAIAAAGFDVAMSTDQRENNRGQIAITKNGNSMTAVADVQVFEVVAGSKSNTFALKCLNGDEIRKYLTAASSSSNYLRSTASIDDNASWTITIDNGSATAVAQGSYTRNTIQYNSAESGKLFACYGSASQAGIVFYRAGLPSANLSFPKESYSANLGESFTAPELTNPYNVSVTYASSDTDVATVDATGAVTIVAAGTTTITASFAGNGSYIASEASYELEVIDPSAERWVKTAIGSITTSDVFVIVGGGYAVTNDNGTSSAPAAVKVSIANDALSEIPDANLRWKLTGSASAGYSFSPASDATKFLYCNTTNASGSNNNIRVGTGDRKVWEFDNGGIMKTKDDYVERYFSKYNNADWRGYVNTSSAIELEFYVKQGGSAPAKTLSSISVTPPTKTTYIVGDSFDATGMVVTATYSDASTADVTASATTDFTSQVASAGNKTVTVSYTEDGVTKTDSFSITVNSAEGSSTVAFTFEDLGFSNQQALTTVTLGGITLTFGKGTGSTAPAYYTSGSAARMYSNNTLEVNAGSKTITGITFTFAGNYTGSLSNWTGSQSTVSFTNTASGQARIQIIEVTYK